ncbi:MAG: hypothetical protein WCG47_25610 [Dermatophilaceae bacterium]
MGDGASQNARRPKPQRHAVLLRLDPAVHEALAKWAADELRSVNAQVEMILRRALAQAGREPASVGPLPRRGRPAKE